MKRALLISALLVLGVSAAAVANPGQLMSSDTVIWAGLDYSRVRMVGPGDFREPSEIFPGFLDTWNYLFLEERLERLADELRKTVAVDIDGVMKQNREATPSQVIPHPEPEDALDNERLTDADLAQMVASYEMESAGGLGLVFIVDRLHKPEAAGSVHVVFFDVATREIVASERFVEDARGFGFRNYWFGVIKRVDDRLDRFRY